MKIDIYGNPLKNLKHLAIQPLSQVPGLDCSIPLKYSASIFKSQLELGLKIQCHKPVRSNPAMTSMTPKTLSIAMVILGLVSSWGISRSKDPIMKHIIEPTNSIMTPISKETWIFVRYLRLLSLLFTKFDFKQNKQGKKCKYLSWRSSLHFSEEE